MISINQLHNFMQTINKREDRLYLAKIFDVKFIVDYVINSDDVEEEVEEVEEYLVEEYDKDIMYSIILMINNKCPQILPKFIELFISNEHRIKEYHEDRIKMFCGFVTGISTEQIKAAKTIKTINWIIYIFDKERLIDVQQFEIFVKTLMVNRLLYAYYKDRLLKIVHKQEFLMSIAMNEEVINTLDAKYQLLLNIRDLIEL